MKKILIKIQTLFIILAVFVPLGVVDIARAAVTSNVSLNMPANSLGLVGYWTMDGPDITWTSDTAGTATDLSGSGNAGTLTSMSKSASAVAGKIGQALDFDGTADYVGVGDPAGGELDFSSSQSFTIAAWVYRHTAIAGAADRIF